MRAPRMQDCVKATRGQKFDTELIYRLAAASEQNPLTVKANVLYLLYVLEGGSS